uniref:hypothetical protein n=1 Tax=Serratia proteamaculans TaxID=28151 RepID=UPI001F4C4457|nr:hypothetical protein [Serratia proteamaculans]
MAPPSLCSGKQILNITPAGYADKAPPGFARHARFLITQTQQKLRFSIVNNPN